MAAQKPTVLFFPALSTVLGAFNIDQCIARIDAVLGRTEQDARFKQTHGMSRQDWDSALSLHLHGDLR